MSIPPDSPTSVEQRASRAYFPTGEPLHDRLLIRRFLVSAAASPLLVLLLFYLNFGVMDSLAIGLAVFLSGYSLLAALGIYMLHNPQYRLPTVRPIRFLDLLGAF